MSKHQNIQLKKGTTWNDFDGSDYRLGDVEKPNRRARKAMLKEHKRILKNEQTTKKSKC